MLIANNDFGQRSDLQEAILDAASFLAYVILIRSIIEGRSASYAALL